MLRQQVLDLIIGDIALGVRSNWFAVLIIRNGLSLVDIVPREVLNESLLLGGSGAHTLMSILNRGIVAALVNNRC